MPEVFLAELRRSLILLVRYPAEALSRVVMVSVLFYGLLMGVRTMAGPGALSGQGIDAAIVGYVLWAVVAFALNNVVWGLQVEAQTGTLEQLYLSPYGPLRIVLLRAAAELGVNLALNAGVFLCILLLTGRRLGIPAEAALPLGALLLGAYGLALGMGAMVLLLRRVHHVLGLLQFVLLPVLMVPVESWHGTWAAVRWLVPLAPAAAVLRDLVARGLPLSLPLLAGALLNGLAWLVAGVALFRGADRAVRRRGLLAAL